MPLYKIRAPRIWEIDTLRGICILLMVFDHFMFNFTMLPDLVRHFYANSNWVTRLSAFAEVYWMSDFRMVARFFVIGAFLSLSGISCAFSRNNALRAVKLAAAAVALSLGTLALDGLLDLNFLILFGILHCLSISVFIYCAIKAAAKKKARYAFLCIGILLAVWGAVIDFYNLPQNMPIPATLAEFLQVIWGTRYLGADCFGILPYTGLFLIGAYGGEVIYRQKRSVLPRLNGAWNKPLMFVGRNTIWVYLLHQPVLIAVLGVILLIMGYQLF